MSAEFRPPFPPGWSASRVQSDKLSKSPPVAFNIQSIGRGHFRSSSLGSFVSRLLPSRRQEKGHTLRSEFNDDSTQDSLGLVINVPGSQPRKSSAEYHGISSALKKSWPRGKSTDAAINFQTPVALDDQKRHFHVQSEQPRRFSLGDIVGIARQARQSYGDETRETPVTGEKKGNALSRIIGSLKRSKGEQKTERRNSDPSRSQIIQLVESKKSCPETAKLSNEKEITKSQQIFEDKKLRRVQRRSLQESEDYLGVQGANPRTGFWDISDGTSSSAQSQMSENTKLKLDQQATKLVEQKKKYEEAQKSYQEELMRLEALNELKKKERAEQKKIESKIRQRRHGKWRASETGWSSVFEPELSPIQQSEAGTPVAELAPGDRLFPMPCAADPTPYVNDTPIKQRDYFGHRAVSSPLAHKRPGRNTDALSITPQGISVPRKPVGLTRRQRTEESSETIIHTHGHPLPSIPALNSISSKGQQNPFFHSHGRRAPSIRVQKPLAGQSEQEVSVCKAYDHRSSDTVQKSFPETAQQQQPKLAVTAVPTASGNSQNTPPHFLEEEILSSKPAGFLEKGATAISSLSISTKQVAIRRPLVQSLGARGIISLNELPPVTLKDPIAARIPLSYQTPKELLTTWVPPTNLRTVPTRLPSFINTSITTTTGCATLLLLPGQVDGASDIQIDIPTRRQYPQQICTQVPSRTSSQRKNRLRGTQKKASPDHPAKIAILSVHQLDLTKERSKELCQITSPVVDKGELKSTLISISTYPQTQKEKEKTAQSAALIAFQQVKHRAAIKKTEDRNGGQLASPKTRQHKEEQTKDTNTKGFHKPARDGDVGTGDPSKIEKEQGTGGLGVLRASPVIAARAAALKFATSDKLAIWHPEPNTENGAAETAETGETGGHMKALVLYKRRGASPRRGVSARGRRAQLDFWQVLTSLAQGAWLVLELVFEAHSDIRKRFERRHLTWQDAGWFIAAAMFMYAVAIVLARIVGFGLLAGKILAIVFMLLFVF